jgi:MFS family permease
VVAIGVLFALYGVYQGVFRAVGKAMAADLSPPQLRASGIGWYGAVVGASGLIASLAAGVLWDRVGHAAVFWWASGFAAAGLAALLTLVPARTHAVRA